MDPTSSNQPGADSGTGHAEGNPDDLDEVEHIEIKIQLHA